MKRSSTIAVAAVIVVLCAVVAWQFVRGVWTSLQLSFADEQTEIFSEMVDKASEAIRREPPDVKAAVAFLDYTHSYYPSGTKQTSGSRLDRIVERSRSLAELRIVEMLRVATDADLGTDAESWIREFANQAVSDR
jgi:hypothetical protein